MIFKVDRTICPDPAAELAAHGVPGEVIEDVVVMDPEDAFLLKLKSATPSAFQPVEDLQ